MYKIGDEVRVTSDNDNDCYGSFRDNVLVVAHIATSQKDHPVYDDSMEGMALYDFEGVDCSLYEYEIEPA
jgi:hypothetical protein